MFSFLRSEPPIDHQTKYSETPLKELYKMRFNEKKKNTNSDYRILEEIDTELVLRSFKTILLGWGAEITKDQAINICLNHTEHYPYHGFFNLALAFLYDDTDLKEHCLLNVVNSRHKNEKFIAQAVVELNKLFFKNKKYQSINTLDTLMDNYPHESQLQTTVQCTQNFSSSYANILYPQLISNSHLHQFSQQAAVPVFSCTAVESLPSDIFVDDNFYTSRLTDNENDSLYLNNINTMNTIAFENQFPSVYSTFPQIPVNQPGYVEEKEEKIKYYSY